MDFNKAYIAYFSPSLSTKRLALHIARAMSVQAPTMQANLTHTSGRHKQYRLGPQDILLAGAPCYGGRLPVVAPGLFDNLAGENTPAVIYVTYGNRAYEDALLELSDKLTQQGFLVIGAAAFVTAHAACPTVGAGRPDAADLAMAEQFGLLMRDRLSAESPDLSALTLDIPGNRPFAERPPAPPLAPETKDNCVLCMQCFRWCPTDAIKYDDPNTTDASRCILCQGCVRRCPVESRVIENEAFQQRVAGMAQKLAGVRNEPELFV